MFIAIFWIIEKKTEKKRMLFCFSHKYTMLPCHSKMIAILFFSPLNKMNMNEYMVYNITFDARCSTKDSDIHHWKFSFSFLHQIK